MSEDNNVYEFGPFRLDAARRRLLHRGEIVPLKVQVFDLLLLFIQNRGRLIEKEELMEKLWPDTIVEESNLTVRISMLRRALGESYRAHEYIETVPRRGYRFMADVNVVGSDKVQLSRAGDRQQGIGLAAPNGGIDSLAVLPLTNLSGDPSAEYLGEGITESIIISLSQIPGLRVMAHNTVSRYKEKDLDVQEVGRNLNVRAVLVGRVLDFNQSLNINTELVDISDGSLIWGARYDCVPQDIIKIPEEIAKAISKKLRLKLTDEEQRRFLKRYTDNLEAYHLYLKGRYCWNKYTKEWVMKAISYFEQATKIDVEYAPAYVGLADSYLRLSAHYLSPQAVMPKAKAYTKKAIELDDLFAEAHSSLGMIELYYEHNWDKAEIELKRAIELSPGNALAHQRYGSFLTFEGRFEEALTEIRKAQELDPLNPRIAANLGNTLNLIKRFDASVALLKQTIELYPNYAPAHLVLGSTYLQSANFEEAIKEFQEMLRLDVNSDLSMGYLGHTYAVAGLSQKALQVLRRLEALAKQKYVSPYSMAIIHVGLNRTKEALKWLEALREERNDWLVWLNVSPEFDSLRSHPKFIELLRHVGFR